MGWLAGWLCIWVNRLALAAGWSLRVNGRPVKRDGLVMSSIEEEPSNFRTQDGYVRYARGME